MFAAAIMFFCMINSTNAQDKSLTVIANAKGAPSSMKMSELISVLKGERQRWTDGTKVQIALMKTTTRIGISTCKKIFNMSGDQVKRHWLELSFAGNADAPTFCNSTEELIDFISQNPGGIGVIDEFSGNENIKVVKIEEKLSF